MKSVPEPVERRLAELDDLFGPERAAYGESYRERLREDEEVSARVRERFERGEALGKYPAISNYLFNLSAKEKEIFFKPSAAFSSWGLTASYPRTWAYIDLLEERGYFG
jgi:hypothetical protein